MRTIFFLFHLYKRKRCLLTSVQGTALVVCRHIYIAVKKYRFIISSFQKVSVLIFAKNKH